MRPGGSRYRFISRVRQSGRLAWVDTYEIAWANGESMLTRDSTGKSKPIKIERVVPMREGKTRRDR